MVAMTQLRDVDVDEAPLKNEATATEETPLEQRKHKSKAVKFPTDKVKKSKVTSKNVEVAQEVTNTTKSSKPIDYKKRYDDLKKHYDRKLGEWKHNKEELLAQVNSTQPKYQAPKTPEELATFRDDYPDVYDVVESVAHLQTQEQLGAIEAKVEQLTQREQAVVQREAESTLMAMQPDFREIRESESFHEWASVQPEVVQGWIYENTTDPTLASKAIDLYKLEAGIAIKRGNKESEVIKEEEKDSRGSAADSISVHTKVEPDPSTQEKIWTTSEISSMSEYEYEEFAEDIENAQREGRIIRDT